MELEPKKPHKIDFIKRLAKQIKKDQEISHTKALELAAKQCGYHSWLDCQKQLAPKTGIKNSEYWISAIDLDSFNIIPKQIRLDQVKEAMKEGFNIHCSKSECQKECDDMNRL